MLKENAIVAFRAVEGWHVVNRGFDRRANTGAIVEKIADTLKENAIVAFRAVEENVSPAVVGTELVGVVAARTESADRLGFFV